MTYETRHYGRRPHHGWHLLLTLLSCGLWAPIWLVIAMNARRSVGRSVTRPRP